MDVTLTCQEPLEKKCKKTIVLNPETKLIHELLLSIGVPPNINGYCYIAYSMELILKEPEYLQSVTKGLYIDVAKHFNTKPACVERAIRFAINNAWQYGDKYYIQSIFKNCVRLNKNVPTNSVFLARLFYYITNMEYYK